MDKAIASERAKAYRGMIKNHEEDILELTYLADWLEKEISKMPDEKGKI